VATTLQHFPILILIGRPASGKSEIIAFLQQMDPENRLKRYHLGDFAVLDDFPMLWTWFEEDAILEKILSKPRLHTDAEGYFKHVYLWHLLIERINLAYHKRERDQKTSAQRTSTIVEFSRGTEHGGYREAFNHLSSDLLNQAGVIYVSVSFEESLRKNRRRFNPQRPESILEHALPDQKLERLYKEDDWQHFSQADDQFLHIGSLKVPYAVFENEDDVTTENQQILEKRLEVVLERLWCLRGEASQLKHPA
jgi:hypothetical protein